jgi:subtilisin
MARFVIANRRAGKFRETDKRAARAAVERAFSVISHGVDTLADNQPGDATARRVLVVATDASTIAAMPKDPDVLVEPEILHFNETFRPTGFLSGESMSNFVSSGLSLRSVEIDVVSSTGARLHGARAHLFLRGPGGIRRELTQLSEFGRVLFNFPSAFEAAMLVIVPTHGQWPTLVQGPQPRLQVQCPELPRGPRGWWHELVGVPRSGAGAGIRVGVADTGVGPHRALAHVIQAGAFIEGQHQPGSAGLDVDAHGTHVCGIIGARAAAGQGYIGIASHVDLISARVFAPGTGANQADITNAIDALSRTHGVDLINLSLGAPVGSDIERDAIQDALERGTLSICAAANAAGAVHFPAAFEETVAVSALGLLGTAPLGSLSSTRLSSDAERFGDANLYLANFSCFGPEVDAVGPGVGIISTVPAREGESSTFGAMDGTSVASPAVCATLAGLLSQDVAYGGLARDILRAQRARQILRQNARDIGLAAAFQGDGLPTFD